ncbi:hypothetical protein EV401DRAFT_1889783 [Pisolithus croceorrhizus]|nr:hypothetical protein EV401DRAFT_1889783 [Pisolithus croceorrhizus]
MISGTRTTDPYYLQPEASFWTTGQHIAHDSDYVDKVQGLTHSVRVDEQTPTSSEFTTASAMDMRPPLSTLPPKGQTDMRKTYSVTELRDERWPEAQRNIGVPWRSGYDLASQSTPVRGSQRVDLRNACCGPHGRAAWCADTLNGNTKKYTCNDQNPALYLRDRACARGWRMYFLSVLDRPHGASGIGNRAVCLTIFVRTRVTALVSMRSAQAV